MLYTRKHYSVVWNNNERVGNLRKWHPKTIHNKTLKVNDKYVTTCWQTWQIVKLWPNYSCDKFCCTGCPVTEFKMIYSTFSCQQKQWSWKQLLLSLPLGTVPISRLLWSWMSVSKEAVHIPSLTLSLFKYCTLSCFPSY